MLNASRHHRKNRCLVQHLARSVMCSTPRGITGKIACGTQGFFEFPGVLNASRHHRKNRFIFIRIIRVIKGLICAQRLAASQEKSHV